MRDARKQQCGARPALQGEGRLVWTSWRTTDSFILRRETDSFGIRAVFRHARKEREAYLFAQKKIMFPLSIQEGRDEDKDDGDGGGL